jgi:glycosyltransferase involved in cell wall biosynthesis
MPRKTLIYSLDTVGHSCWHIRLHDPLEALKREFSVTWGVNHTRNWLYKHTAISSRYISSADLIVVQRFFPQRRTRSVMQKLKTASAPVIFDLDDNLLGLPEDHGYYPSLFKVQALQEMKAFAPYADAISVSTPVLAKEMAAFNHNVHVLPNLINDQLWTSGTRSKNGKITILFGGTPTHAQDATVIEDVLLELCRRHPDRLSFVFMGCVTERLAMLPGARYIEFQPSYQDYARSLQAEPIDLAVVPLEDIAFNRCKSNIKWLEYSMCGIPGVYSAIAPYAEVEQGRTGLLARTATDWLEALDVMIQDAGLRRSLAEEARRDVLARFSLSQKVHKYAEFYESVINTKLTQCSLLNR